MFHLTILTTDFDWCFELEEHRLLHENLTCDLAEQGDVLLADFNVTAARINHLIDDGVDVESALSHCTSKFSLSNCLLV